MKRTTYWRVITNGAGYMARRADWYRTKAEAVAAYAAAECADPVEHYSYSNPEKIQDVELKISQREVREAERKELEQELMRVEVFRQKGEALRRKGW